MKQFNMSKEIIDIIKDKKIFKYIIFGIIFLLISTGSTLLFPSIASKMLDIYFKEKFLNANYLIFMIILSVISVISAFFQVYVIYLMSERFSFLLRNRIFDKIINMPEKYFVENEKSKLLTILMSDVNFVKEILSQFAIMLIMGLLMIFGSVILMFSLNYKLALIIILLVPLFFILIMLLSKKLRSLFMKVQGERDNFNRVIDENVKASMLIRVFTSEKTEIEKFEKTNLSMYKLNIKIIEKISLIIPLVNLVNFIGVLVIILVGGIFTIKGTMTLGQISAFSNYVTMFIMPLIMLSMMSNMIGQAIASVTRISSLLDFKNYFKDGKEEIKNIISIDIKSLNFHLGKKKILDNVNFEINKGEKIGIIGLTGSGKSILMQQILRIIEPDSGKIFLNDKDIKDYKIDSIREKTGVVFQDNFLIDDTIDANIDFKRNLSKDEIVLARKISDVEEFYLNNSSNYKIGEEGKKLSGGQKQRLRIARAIAGKPDLLILDDCTSNLDVKTEKKIVSNIRKILTEISIIIISQKIASLSDCDRIYVMDNGKITEVGTHKELLERSLIYKEIELTQKNRHNHEEI